MFHAPRKVARLMHNFEPPWFVAGGWAIDLFLERETRTHDDIEIGVLRRDQLALRKHLAGWRLRKAVGGELKDWTEDEFLELPVHEIHCFNETNEPKFLEVLLNESDGANWIFRRRESVTKPLSETTATSGFGIRFLRPEIVLLYKSKNPRPKDERDFRAAAKRLDVESARWLKNALSVCCAQHAWLEILEDL